MQTNIIYNEDCLKGMAKLPDNCVSMNFTDLPYGMTDCYWDKKISLPEFWKQNSRILKRGGVTVLTSIQPFTTEIINSNLRDFKYCWYWIKNGATGFCFCNYQPMRNVEDICVFYKKAPAYHPQGLRKRDQPLKKFKHGSDNDTVYKRSGLCDKEYTSQYTNYPRQTLRFDKETKTLHPTQKPVALIEYLIKTYTNPGDIVLDCCMGSGTTAVACRNTGRQYIGFELDKKYFDLATRRISEPTSEKPKVL